jgi:hypothetical protein
MRLVNAIKPVSVNIAGKSYALKPSLRCAYLLAHREGGYEALLKQLSENSVTAIRDVLSACDPEIANAFDRAIMATPLGYVLFNADEEFGLDQPTPLNERLIEYLVRLLDINPGNRVAKSPGQPAPKSKPQDFAPMLERLFEIGTGWLGWSAQGTWNAAPAEIIAAHKGRVALLRAIFGSKDDDDTPKEVQRLQMPLPVLGPRENTLLVIRELADGH